MMNKEVYLKNVAESLALLSREVSILNAVNLYDINIVAEDFFPGLLNLIYGYELKNANYLEKNAPANAPTHINPACPRLNSPKIPTVKLRETAIIT